MAETTPFAEETITVSVVAIGPTVSTFRPGGFSSRIKIRGLVEVLSGEMLYRLDSASATPDIDDHLGPIGTIIDVEDASRLRMIRNGAVDAKVKITYFIK